MSAQKGVFYIRLLHNYASPPPILIKFSTDVHKTLLTHPIMSFIKIGTVTAILYLGMGMNFMWVKFNLRVLHINAIDHLIVL